MPLNILRIEKMSNTVQKGFMHANRSNLFLYVAISQFLYASYLTNRLLLSKNAKGYIMQEMLSANISHSLHSKCYKRHMIYFIIGGELVGGNNTSLRKR